VEPTTLPSPAANPTPLPDTAVDPPSLRASAAELELLAGELDTDSQSAVRSVDLLGHTVVGMELGTALAHVRDRWQQKLGRLSGDMHTQVQLLRATAGRWDHAEGVNTQTFQGR
jgi:hypothetical protein